VATLDLAWWALAVLEVLGFTWLVALAAGYWRLRRLLREAERRALLAEKARKEREIGS
jgi:hypothetical protein